MQNETLKVIKEAVKYWYLPLFLGFGLVLVGLWIFFTPVTSFASLSVLFIVTFLLTGFVEIIYALANHHRLYYWRWSLAAGVMDILIGILLILQPQISVLLLRFYVGFGILFRSVMAIGWSWDMKRRKLRHWRNLTILGFIGLVIIIIMLWNPLLARVTFVAYTALAFIALGIFQIYLSFKLKNVDE